MVATTGWRAPFAWASAKMRASGNGLLELAAALITPFIEKNPTKALTTRAKVVFSMSRIIVALFAYAMLKQILRAGIAGWPDAIFCIAIVFAIPLLSALDKVTPERVLAFGEVLLNRFGIGDVRKIGSVFTPHEWKDGKEDGVA